MHDELTTSIIQAAQEVHELLGGPGLVESVYESALCYELILRKVPFQRQVAVPVLYKGKPVRKPLFLDIVIENKLVVEIKALSLDTPYYIAQLQTHLHFAGLASGILINFGKESLKDGIFCIHK
jgi:GxxExxY protein